MTYERVRAEVDLGNLAHNIHEIQKTLPVGTRIMAVVKADAYGHGAIPVSRELLAAGADYLGVALCAEGLDLRENGITAPILILGGASSEDAFQAVQNDLIQTVYSVDQAEATAQAASALGINAKVHVKIDSGMGRLGFLPDKESLRDIIRVCRMPGITPTGIYSHFAFSDGDAAYTGEQYEKFRQFVEALEKEGLYFPCKHISNSGAITHAPGFSFDMVRPGIILYGVKPSASYDLDIRPVMTLKSCLRQIKKIKAGESIGYNRTYITGRDTLVGIVPVGYADGYSRLLSNRGSVLIQEQFAPVIGNVCMDMFMVDITDIPSAKVGEEVVLMGRQGALEITAATLGELQGTIGYEVLCNVSRRVPRKYI